MSKKLVARGVLASLVIGLFVLPASAAVLTTHVYPEQPGNPVTATDILGVVDMGGVSVSPNGKVIAVTTQSADSLCNCYHDVLWLTDSSTHTRRRLADLGQPVPTVMPDGTVNGWPIKPEALWSYDGRYLAFLVNDKGVPRLHVFNAATAEISSIALPKDTPWGFTWLEHKDELLLQTGGANPSVVEHYRLGQRDGFLYGDDFLGDPAGMPIYGNIPVPSALSNSKIIAPGPRAIGRLVDIDLRGEVRAASQSEKLFATKAEFAFFADPHLDATRAASDDGRYTIDIVGITDPNFGRSVQLNHGRTIPSATLCHSTSPATEVKNVYWDRLDRKFLLICSKTPNDRREAGEGREFLELDPVSGATNALFELQPVDPEGDLGRSCDVGGGEIACVVEEPNSPPQLVTIHLDGEQTVIFDPNSGLRAKHFSRIDHLELQNRFGAWAHADLVYPSNYIEGRKYPLVITQYGDSGFLRGNVGDENPIFPYAEAGYFVLSFSLPPMAPASNKATPYDARFKAEVQGGQFLAWLASRQDSLDIVIKNLIGRGMVDPRRLAYTGLSGGANQIDWALAHGRPMAVAITSTCCLGPSDWPLFALLNISPSATSADGLLGVKSPGADPSLHGWDRVAPGLHIDSITAAILANSSEGERFGALPMWALMQFHHKPMELYVYADEHHVKFHPAHLAAIFQRNIDWLQFWLSGQENQNPPKREQYDRWEKLCDLQIKQIGKGNTFCVPSHH